MSLKNLRTLVAIADTGSFVAAASRLGLTQSAVSQQIQALEAELGVTLFDRHGRSPQLNTDGREACARAAEILQRYGQLADDLGDSGQRGTLEVGATYMVQTGSLAPVLAAFRKAWPEVYLRVFRGMSSDLVERVEVGELDAVITTGPPQSPAAHCCWHPLDSERFYLIAPLAMSCQSLQTLLAEADYIRFDRRAWAGTLIDDELQRQGYRLNETMEMDSLLAALRMIEHGLGVTIMPLNRQQREDVASRFHILPFGDENLQREVGLYRQRSHNRRLLVDGLLAEFHQYYAELDRL